MNTRHYFLNCRGADFIPSYQTVWTQSGLVPTTTSSFSGITPTMNSNELKFNGATVIATWAHFTEKDISKQLNILKKAGVNLIRVHLNMYAWASLGEKFIKRIKTMARLASDKKLRIQWVLFEAETPDDVGGVAPNGAYHSTGGKDPSSLYQAMELGLLGAQRCPTVYNNNFICRNINALTVSGNNYIDQVIAAVSEYQSTLSWEVMANVHFDQTKNPADVDAYKFLSSAIDRVKQSKPADQKVTTSFKYLTVDVNHPKYDQDLLPIISKLDYLCYRLDQYVGPFKKYFAYIQAMYAASVYNKSILAVNAGEFSQLNSLRSDILDTSSFNLGFIADGIIDLNLGNKDNNNSKGLFFFDGTTRDSSGIEALKNISKHFISQTRDLTKRFENRNFNPILPEQVELFKDILVELPYLPASVASSLEFFGRWNDRFDSNTASALWADVKNSILTSRKYKTLDNFNIENVGTFYAPFEASYLSKQQSLGIANKQYEINLEEIKKGFGSDFVKTVISVLGAGPIGAPGSLFAFAGNYLSDYWRFISAYIETGNPDLANIFRFEFADQLTYAIWTAGIPYNGNPYYGDFERNRLAYIKVKLIELLIKGLAIPQLDEISENAIPFGYPQKNELITTPTKNSILNLYEPLAPSGFWKTNTSSIIPYVEDATLLRGWANLSTSEVSSVNKPVCFYQRGPGYLSGSCWYDPAASISAIDVPDNVLAKINWKAYDEHFAQLSQYILLAFAECLGGLTNYINRIKQLEQQLYEVRPKQKEVYQSPGPNAEHLRSNLFSVQVLDGIKYDNCFVYSSTAKFGVGGVSGARSAFYLDPDTGEYKNRLWKRNDKPVISYTTFGASAFSEIVVRLKDTTISSFDIKPKSKNFYPYLYDGGIKLYLNPKDKAWISVNGDVANTLFIFADPPKPQIPTEKVLYFGRGIHHVSSLSGATVITASSSYSATPGDGIARTETFHGASFSAFHNYGYIDGQDFTIYLDGGSYVIGQFDFRGKNNIKVIGPGIVAGDNVVEQCTRFQDDDFHTRMEPYGILSQFRGVTYAYQEQGLNTYDRVPSGLVVNGPTIVNCHFLTMPGINTIDNVKVLSPFMPNTDIKGPMPDKSTSSAIMRDCMVFLGDDAIVPTPYNAFPTNPNTGYLNIGGKFDISGCQVYTTNGGPLVLSYFGVLYPSSTPRSYPIKVYDMDFGIYSYNEGGGGRNGIPLDSEHGEVAIRIIMDMSSVYSGTWSNGLPKYGLNNVLIKNIRFDEQLDQALFWVGNVPDPYYPTPVPFRGQEYGSLSSVSCVDITVSPRKGFASKLRSNLLFAKDSTNKPKDILFKNIKIGNTYLASGNYQSYFQLSGPISLGADNIRFETPTVGSQSVEIYPSPFEAPLSATNLSYSSYSDISSTLYEFEVYDNSLEKFVSAPVYRCGHQYAVSLGYTEFSVFGTGNISGVNGSQLGIAPWGPSALVKFNYVNFGISSTTDVKINFKGGNLSLSNVSVGPFSKNKDFSIIDLSSILITDVNPYDKLAVEINFDTSNPMFVFANPIKTPIPTPYVVPSISQDYAGGPGDTVYFGPGFYELSAFGNRNAGIPADNGTASALPVWTFVVQDDQTIYLDAGAYVRGNFDHFNASGVKFIGPGTIDNYWLNDWWQRLSNEHEEKLRLATFKSANKFFEGPQPAAGKAIGHIGRDFTVVNGVMYFVAGLFKEVDNVKTFCPYYNCDGPRVGSYGHDNITKFDLTNSEIPGKFNLVLKPEHIGKITRCFLMHGDDAYYMNKGAIASGNYHWEFNATVFRSYMTPLSSEKLFRNAYTPAVFDAYIDNVLGTGFSAIDIDIRSYSPYAFGANKYSALHNTAKISIFGLWASRIGGDEPDWVANYNAYEDLLFSGIRVENPTDTALFDIGSRPYPFITGDPSLGTEFTNHRANRVRGGDFRRIIFEDISISGHPSSIGNYVASNAIFGLTKETNINDVTFKNVTINGTPITNQNIDSYCDFEYVDVIPNSQYFSLFPGSKSYYGSSIVDFYFLIGDSIANGSYGQLSALSANNEYSSLASGVSGCYIFRGIPAYGTTGEFGAWTGPRFEPLRPGKNTIPEETVPSDPYTELGLEVSLFNSLRKATDRDIYIVKLSRSGTIAFSGTSSTFAAADDWSVSSSNEMFDKFKHWSVSALNIIRNTDNRIPDFKGGVIVLGTNVPSYYTNEEFTRDMINKEVSSLYEGIRYFFAGSSVDVNEARVIWALPRGVGSGWGNYYNYIEEATRNVNIYDKKFIPFYLNKWDNDLADAVHYNTSGFLRLGEALADVFYRETESYTDPRKRPGLNINFISGTSEPVKVNRKYCELYDPKTESLRSNKFTVEVFDELDYKPAYVFSRGRRADAAYGSDAGAFRNRLWVSGSTPYMHFLTFGTSATTKVRVGKIGSNVTSIDIRPKSKNIPYEIKEDGFAYIDMSPLQKAWITVNNELSSPLFIFADPFKPDVNTFVQQVATGRARGAYFGPGITHLSAIPLPGPHQGVTFSGEISGTNPLLDPTTYIAETFYGLGFSSFDTTYVSDKCIITPYVEGQDYFIYLDGGAYVIGSMNLRNRNNVKVIGPGIISMENVMKDKIENPYFYRMNSGFLGQSGDSVIPIESNWLYEHLRNTPDGYVSSYGNYPTGNIIDGPTIIDYPYYGPRGQNRIINIKLISPWVANTDGFYTIPDYKDKLALMVSSLCFVADDCCYAQDTSFNNFPHIGGNSILSSCSLYTVNNGIISQYFPFAYYGGYNSVYKAIIQDVDCGMYSTNRPNSETPIRLTVDASSFDTELALSAGIVNFEQVLGNVTVSGLRFDDPIENELFWIGNIPDPFANYAAQPVLGDRGDEAGKVRDILIADIEASSTFNYSNLSGNPIIGKSEVSGFYPQNILFKNIKINGNYIDDDNRNNFINWVSADVFGGFTTSNADITNPKYYPQRNINFSRDQVYALSAFSGPGILGKAEIYDGPGKEASSMRSAYDVRVYRDGYYSDTFVYSATRQAWTPVSGNSLFQSGTYPPMNWVTIGCSGPVGLKIPNVTSVDIKPKSKIYSNGNNYSIINNNLYIVVNPLDKLWLTLNNQVSSPLFIFADPYKPPVPRTTTDVTEWRSLYPSYQITSAIYFGPGVHNIGANYPIGMSSLVYFDGGSVVKGTFKLSNDAYAQVRFMGPGVLMPSSTQTAESFHSTYDSASHIDKINSGYVMIRGPFNTLNTTINGYPEAGVYNNTISGLTIVNSPWYSVYGGFNEITNFKLISPWYHSTYGPSIIPQNAAENIPLRFATFTNSFIFNGDNGIIDLWKNNADYLTNYPPGHGSGKITVSNVFVNSVNNAPIGIYAPQIYNTNEYQVIVKDIDVGVYQNNRTDNSPSNVLAMMHIYLAGSSNYNGGKVSFKNMTFENVRSDNTLSCPVFRIVNSKSPFENSIVGYNSDGSAGFTENLVFKNFTVSCLPIYTSSNIVSGANSIDRPDGLTFTNLRINGEFVNSNNYSNYFIFNQYTSPTGIYDSTITFNLQV